MDMEGRRIHTQGHIEGKDGWIFFFFPLVDLSYYFHLCESKASQSKAWRCWACSMVPTYGRAIL